jgi:uncharacterized protein (DUF1810 family)
MPSSRLQRFKDAQDRRGSGFDSALSEIRAGEKRGHWIWYVFPQLSGLGHSAASRTYGLDGIAEAEDYLRDPLLRSRLLTIATAVAEQVREGSGLSLQWLMDSSIDVRKLVSSLTLFGNVAKQLYAAEGLDEYESIARVAQKVLAVAATEGYPPCQFTLDHRRRTTRAGRALLRRAALCADADGLQSADRDL